MNGEGKMPMDAHPHRNDKQPSGFVETLAPIILSLSQTFDDKIF